MAGRGGPRPGAGRKPGTPNKATTERLLRAAQEIDSARRGEKELAKDVLERMMKLAEGAAGVNRPTTQSDINEGKQTNPDGDWNRFGEWFDRTAYCAKELAKYQSPTFKAIAVHVVPDQTNVPLALPAPQTGGNVVAIDDPESAMRVYKRMIATVR